MADNLNVTAEASEGWVLRGERPRVADATPDVSLKVQEGLKEALRAQLATEVGNLGGLGEKLTIHGRTGVSNLQDTVARPSVLKK